MQGFVQEAGTIGLEDASTTFRVHLHKTGAANGWSSSQLPITLVQGSYEIEVELKESSTGNVMIGFATEEPNLLATYPGAVANSWGYYCANGNKYIAGTHTAFGVSARTGDRITMRFTVDNTNVAVYKNLAMMGTLRDIPFASRLKFFVALHTIGEHVLVRLTFRPTL